MEYPIFCELSVASLIKYGFFWLQGIKSAPWVVEQCLKSWQKHNPEWEVVVIDNNNLKEYIDLPSIVKSNINNITNPTLSDLLRINLLKNHGGVWVDATLYCQVPLNDWLEKYLKEGFFAFHEPATDRPISSWFLVAEKNNYLVEKYCQKVNKYWLNTVFRKEHTFFWDIGYIRIQRILMKQSYTSFKFSFYLWLLKRLRVYPYFWFHYTFAKCLKSNPTFKSKWSNVNKLSSDSPHLLLHRGLVSKLDDEIKERIKSKKDPIYKLTYKYNEELYDKGSILKYLIEGDDEL